MRHRKEMERFGQRLREAHDRLRSLAVPEPEKSRLFRRLVVIADAAKHDVLRAGNRLERFIRDLDDGGDDTGDGTTTRDR